MADDQDESTDGHTDEEHIAQGKITIEIFEEALRKCVGAGICKLVLIAELVDILVGTAISEPDVSLADVVAQVIDQYFASTAARAQVVMRRRARVH